MVPELGIIEGFYGPLWTWEERAHLMGALAETGYGFYLYAPKADPYLRRRWTEPHPEKTAQALEAFGKQCRAQGVRFGVGLSPFEVFNDFGDEAQGHLEQKLRFLDQVGIEELAILFDDMQGTTPDLAGKQARIMDWVGQRTGADTLTICPTYYSDDPVLDRVFGARPEHYLEALGKSLDPAVRVFWTGEEVCSREITPGHLKRVGEALGRKPLLWDNYPVNDGERMSNHLHLRGFSGRHAANEPHVKGHAINPALQSHLSVIPAMTLVQSYRQGDDYQYMQTFYRAAVDYLGQPLADCLQADLLLLQDAGLNRLSEEKKAQLSERYGAFDHPAAWEIVAWLRGDYHVSGEQVATQ